MQLAVLDDYAVCADTQRVIRHAIPSRDVEVEAVPWTPKHHRLRRPILAWCVAHCALFEDTGCHVCTLVRTGSTKRIVFVGRRTYHDKTSPPDLATPHLPGLLLVGTAKICAHQTPLIQRCGDQGHRLITFIVEAPSILIKHFALDVLRQSGGQGSFWRISKSQCG
jgi:hypothetical protein